MTKSVTHSPRTAKQRFYAYRNLKDRLNTWGMGIGGISVIIAILLIFFYLLVVVFPLFLPADMEPRSNYDQPEPGAGQTVFLTLEEQNRVAVRFTDQAKAVFFDVKTGAIKNTIKLLDGKKAKVSSFSHAHISSGKVAYGLSNGQAIIAEHGYDITYPNDQIHIGPKITYPLGNQNFVLDKQGKPIKFIAFESNDEKATIIGITEDNRTILLSLVKESDGLDESVFTFKESRIELPPLTNVQKLLIDSVQRTFYSVHTNGTIAVFDISDTEEISLRETVNITDENQIITHVSFLTGDISLLIGLSDGTVSQWFPVNRETGVELKRIRDFSQQDGAILDINTEQRRKGFVTATKNDIALFNSTARRQVLNAPIDNSGQDKPAIRFLGLSPRADTLLIENEVGHISTWHIENEHPEISWSVLWEKVWYESYDDPEYIWQSSSASNDFEPKYSLMPLAFGTLKAAFYAMLFAVPLALLGAIYTAYFMAPTMRAYVKPSIEIMEALPTVILGFLAGLWLAPFMEAYLPGVFSILIIIPLGVLLFAYAWRSLPKKYRLIVPDGWQAALLIPVVCLLGWFAMGMSHPIEVWLFDGNMPQWLNNHGFDFDQRNSLVVGIAMGIAVIPTIFSIAEDAIFSVPKHLTFGSLALGATPWQTLVRVVILTASPGIFSAIMIGLGRAVGETMIVLMATGNTPVMDLSIFQGMRTLSANIAVEMPESEVASTHYRILFLAALVLFTFTFIFNTAAEIVRQRLRRKYSSL